MWEEFVKDMNGLFDFGKDVIDRVQLEGPVAQSKQLGSRTQDRKMLAAQNLNTVHVKGCVTIQLMQSKQS